MSDNYKDQGLEHLEKQYNELGEAIKQLKEKKKWEPESGVYVVNIDGVVITENNPTEISNFGIGRKTVELAFSAHNKMRVFNRLLAYVDEFAPDYEFDTDSDNYYIELNNGVYMMDFDVNFMKVGAIYMPKQTAIELCDKLNSGEVWL